MIPERMRRLLRVSSAPRLFLPSKSVPVVMHSKGIHVMRAWSQHFDAGGRLLWDEGAWSENILHDEGEQAILSAYFDTDLAGYGAPPANLYVGLDARASVAEADTLASLSGEPATGGYARLAASTTTGFTLTQPGAYYQAATGTLAFTPSGANWGTIRNRFLCTVSSGTAGKLVTTIVLSAVRTVNDGDTLNTTVIVGLNE